VKAGAFFGHRGLIAAGAGGAAAEALLLSFVVPAARPLAPQVTALPPLAAYHDLRWLFAFGQGWLGFTGLLVLFLVVRSAADAALLLLAWPEGARRPRFAAAAASCAVLTVLVWLVLSPVVTLMFGVALVPFSWPYLGAVPILLGSALLLSHGGAGRAWWRRLPGASTAAWLLASFLGLSLVAAVMPRLDTPGIVAISAVAGVLNARAWYGLALAGVRRSAHEVPQTWRWRFEWRTELWRLRHAVQSRTNWLPVAPVAAILVLALVIGLTRLAFTGTIQINPETGGDTAASQQLAGGSPLSIEAGAAGAQPPSVLAPPAGPHGAVLVVAGFGSRCCNDASPLAAAEPGMLVRQFSYLGLTASGQPISYAQAADLPIQVLGDRMAIQVQWLHNHTHKPVSVVAESEGTLGLYAMLARHPGLPIGSLVLLSPIIQPGQVGSDGVPGEALTTLNRLVGRMSPYGSAGAQQLITSVSQVGAEYFAEVAKDRGSPYLAIVPLADAVTMLACPLPQQIVFVEAFHGGLLGNAEARGFVTDFLNREPVPASQHLRSAALLISAGAAAWRMPDLYAPCPMVHS
jgi:hypothetical protein